MTTTDQLIKIELTPFESELFIKFQKHHQLFESMEAVKAFDIKGGSLLLHFNSLGEIKGIEKKEYFNIT